MDWNWWIWCTAIWIWKNLFYLIFGKVFRWKQKYESVQTIYLCNRNITSSNGINFNSARFRYCKCLYSYFSNNVFYCRNSSQIYFIRSFFRNTHCFFYCITSLEWRNCRKTFSFYFSIDKSKTKGTVDFIGFADYTSRICCKTLFSRSKIYLLDYACFFCNMPFSDFFYGTRKVFERLPD